MAKTTRSSKPPTSRAAADSNGDGAATATASRPRSGSAKSGGGGLGNRWVSGKHLVIVESPSKAKTINKYLGGDYVVLASVGHIRDLPSRNPKGVKSPVPGVDLKKQFKPTYEILAGKAKTMAE